MEARLADGHPEDRKNTTFIAAARRGEQVEVTWPDDLATARYLWRKLGNAISRAEFTGVWEYGDEDYLAAEVIGDKVHYSVPADLRLAKFMHAELDSVLTDKEWEIYVQAAKVRGEVFARENQRVKLEGADMLKRIKGGRN